jgi:soluble lytic murein transglycosylase
VTIDDIHKRGGARTHALAMMVALVVAGTAGATERPATLTPVKATVQNGAPATAAATSRPMASAAVRAEEAAHTARYDAAIAAARDHALTATDAQRLRDAFVAIGAGRAAEARAGRDQLADPIARKILDWGLFRAGAGTAREIRNFRDANATWPDRELLTRRAEEALFAGGGSVAEIKAFFATEAPRSGVGLAALASAVLADGNAAQARTLAAEAWRAHDIPATLETGFLERFKPLLTEADHKWRLDRLLANDSRWTNERAERAQPVRRLIPLLSAAERKKAEARLAVYLRSSSADQLMAALPVDAATKPAPDWGFALQLAQWHRRAGRHETAAEIMARTPHTKADLVSPDDWWEERRANAYDALRAGRIQSAYALVRTPGELGANPMKDATFLAGWIALSHLKQPAEAAQHFNAFAKAADGPLSRAKSNYWLARTQEALGQADAATASYRKAAAEFDTFYGLLSRKKLDPKAELLTITPPSAPTAADAQRFTALDGVRAIVIARKAGLDISITRAFLAAMRNSFTAEVDLALLAHLAEAIGDTQSSLRIGKYAIARGLNLAYYAYPLHAMPAYAPLRTPPEPAFLYAVARQESEFNALTMSGAGARGVLQVMPITAQHVCRDYKLTCQVDRLMKDPSYNVMLGSAYIGDRMAEFRGSYVLTLAGYNAGPGRARQWIREFGDPRDGRVDPLDWIHTIPFEETREYVQKVMANIQVYRARLGERVPAARFAADLKRNAGDAPRQVPQDDTILQPSPPAATSAN